MKPISSSEKKIIRLGAFLLTMLIVFNCLRNVQYYNPDEHYQIIEFAAYKQGKVQATDLAWEYTAQSRQAIQPIICYTVFQTLDAIGIQHPVDQIRSLRILTGLFALWCIVQFVRSGLKFFTGKYRMWFIWVSFIFWIVPYYYVRFTSEAFSQSLFLLALSFIFDERKNWKIIAAGGVLALAFYARFQLLFGMMGLTIALIWIEKFRFREFSLLTLGAMTGIGAGILSDHWLYNQWVFTPWNYFDYQVLRNVAGSFGKSSALFYFRHLLLFSTPIIGVFIYLMLFALPLLKKINTVYLIFTTTLLILSIVGRIGFRLLIPNLDALPVHTVCSMQDLNIQRVVGANWLQKKGTVILLLVFNTMALILSGMYNNNYITDNPKGLSYAVASDYQDKKIHVLYFESTHPFKDDVILPFQNRTLHLYQQFLMPD